MLIGSVQFKQGLSGLFTLNHDVWDLEWKTWEVRAWISGGLFTNISGGWCWLLTETSAQPVFWNTSTRPSYGSWDSSEQDGWVLRASKNPNKAEALTAFPNLAWEITQHHYCCILPIRSKLLKWTIFKREELDSILCGKSVKELAGLF